MKQTIYYMSNVKWFSHATGKYSSKHRALKSHLNYITSSQDFRFAIGDKKVVLENSKKADKRINSRIAFSFVFALPNNLSDKEVKLWMERVRDILIKQNNMSEENIFIGYHESKGISQMGNKHLHVVGVNLDKNGKSIVLGRGKDEVQNLHQKLQKLILDAGYTIKKDKEPVKHLGVRLRYDKELKENYLALLKIKQAHHKLLSEAKSKREAIKNTARRNLQVLYQNKSLLDDYIKDLKSKNVWDTNCEKLINSFLYKHNILEKYLTNFLSDNPTINMNEINKLAIAYNEAKREAFRIIQQAYAKYEQSVTHNSATQIQSQNNEKTITTQSQDSSKEALSKHPSQPDKPLEKSAPDGKPPIQLIPKQQHTKPTDIPQSDHQRDASKPPTTPIDTIEPHASIMQNTPQDTISKSPVIHNKDIKESTQSPDVSAQHPSQPKPDVYQNKEELITQNITPSSSHTKPPKQRLPQEQRQKRPYIIYTSNREVLVSYTEQHYEGFQQIIDTYQGVKVKDLPDNLTKEDINNIKEDFIEHGVIIIVDEGYFEKNKKMLMFDEDIRNILRVHDYQEQDYDKKIGLDKKNKSQKIYGLGI